jgi:hypothetical protein
MCWIEVITVSEVNKSMYAWDGRNINCVQLLLSTVITKLGTTRWLRELEQFDFETAYGV